jgi:hypothetical protein
MYGRNLGLQKGVQVFFRFAADDGRMRATIVPSFVLSRETLRQKVLAQRNDSPARSSERRDCDQFLWRLSSYEAPDTKGLRQQAERDIMRSERFAHRASPIMQAVAFTCAMGPLVGSLVASYCGLPIGFEAFAYIAGGALVATGILAAHDSYLARGDEARKFCTQLTRWEQRLAPRSEAAAAQPIAAAVEQPPQPVHPDAGIPA